MDLSDIGSRGAKVDIGARSLPRRERESQLAPQRGSTTDRELVGGRRASRGLGRANELVPRGLADPRFAYRKRDVPAASHPTVSAALVRAAGVRADDLVWDPFVGSGTELVERAVAGPYAGLAGTDNDPRAIDAARENLAAAGVQRATLTLADATSFVPPRATVVITNPPMGLRVARSPAFVGMLERFVAHVAHVLPAGGRFVWLSPLPARSSRWAKDSGLSLRAAVKVDMGDFSPMQTLVKDG